MLRFPVIKIYVRRMRFVAAIVQNEAASSLCAPSDYAIDPLSQSTLHLHPPVRLMQRVLWHFCPHFSGVPQDIYCDE